MGLGRATGGDLDDAIQILDHLRKHCVNAVELLSMAEFDGNVGWGYGNTHHFCVESSAGGRDKYRHLNLLEAISTTIPPDLLTNSGTFTSGAAFLVEEMHVDGFRVDLTDAIHRNNKLYVDGRELGHANVYGQNFLCQWSRTLRMIKPAVILIAEDRTGWDAITKPSTQGGLGFQAKWDLGFYHCLIGDSDYSGGWPRLFFNAGLGENDALQFDHLSEALYNTRYYRVIVPESRDEAGNAGGPARTIVVAVNHAPLFGPTRTVAKARYVLCYGLSLLSAATPVFFMGEEVGAQQPYRYNNFLHRREDIIALRDGIGRPMFHFFKDLIS
ncbi:glycoside hydrolase superfamily [Pyrenochaeta sp. MPI-SDFR-AT-0127]|nr:glycoside hydrolase superfamily [Pyrenochaeta sp. MPI-SDFR-AT-0127]